MTNLPRIEGMAALGTSVQTASYYDLNFASVGVSTEAGSTYTFRPTDSGGWVRFTSSSAVTATIAPFSSVEFGLGVVIWVEQAGTGPVSIAAGAGVTVHGAGITSSQYSVIRLVNVGKNVWNSTWIGAAGSTGPIVNVMDFGAVADGITNDTAAFQAAVNSVASGAYVLIFVPRGSYLLNSNVTSNGRIVSWRVDPDTSFSGAGKIVPASVGFFAALDNVAKMQEYLQRGTPSVPWNNLNPMVSLVEHRSSAGVSSGIPQAPLYVAAYKYDTGTSGRATAIFSEGLDPTGGATTFVEGIRSHGIRTTAAAAGGSVQGAVFLAEAADAAPSYVLGAESEVVWSNAGATDAPITTLFSTSRFMANFLATVRVGVKPDALFMGNPFNIVAARAGVLIPAGSVDYTAFASKAATFYGLDLGQGTQSIASIRLPNVGQIASVNAAGNGNLNLLYANASNQLVLGTDAVQVLVPVSVKAHSSTAIPAGGTAGAGVLVSSATNFGVFFGSGAPTLAAAKGSLYLRSDGTTTNDRAYINTNGSTTWTALTTAA